MPKDLPIERAYFSNRRVPPLIFKQGQNTRSGNGRKTVANDLLFWGTSFGKQSFL